MREPTLFLVPLVCLLLLPAGGTPTPLQSRESTRVVSASTKRLVSLPVVYKRDARLDRIPTLSSARIRELVRIVFGLLMISFSYMPFWSALSVFITFVLAWDVKFCIKHLSTRGNSLHCEWHIVFINTSPVPHTCSAARISGLLLAVQPSQGWW